MAAGPSDRAIPSSRCGHYDRDRVVRVRLRGGAFMKRALSAILFVITFGSCMSVRVAQRDGCWVRETKRLWTVKEDLGPCGRPEPKWAEDRLTRVVQECMAQTDYRWQSRALEAWSRGQPLPERPSEDSALKGCMEEVAGSQIGEVERLKQRLSEVSGERDSLEARTQKDHDRLLTSHDKAIDDLGQAAKRPPAPATATANASSEGRTVAENALPERVIAGESTVERPGHGERPKRQVPLNEPRPVPVPPAGCAAFSTPPGEADSQAKAGAAPPSNANQVESR